jgi:hypothetical protein
VLAVLLLAAPAVMWAFDGTHPRGSVSAYHDMSPVVAFYYPLTVLAALLIVNGVLKREHWYGIFLGVFLSGVLFFDHDGDSRPLHVLFAALFFAGSVGVVFLTSKHVSKALGATFLVLWAGAGVVALALSVFWAEWIGMGIYALHYILDSIEDGRVPYHAAEPGETPDALQKLGVNVVAGGAKMP